MQSHAATLPLRLRRPARGRAVGWLLLGGLAACAAAPPAYRPRELTAEELQRCRDAEQAYREGLPDYAARRDELAKDPVTAAWLVRMFVRDLILRREGRPLGEDDELLRAAAGRSDPVADRARAEILALGAVAVPTLVGDLLRHAQPQPRELGIELCAAIGAPAVPALAELARDPEPRCRRAAARSLATAGVGDAGLSILRELAGDPDYTVRADALRGLRGAGPAAGALLRQRLQADPDPFVRRVAAQALAGHRDRATAAALVDHLERCKRDEDHAGEQAAQKSLQALAAARGPRTVEAWRRWLSTFDPDAPR